jgi:hypothetical protein
MVPATMPYQLGATYDGILDVMTPRVLFPDKGDMRELKVRWPVALGMLSPTTTTTIAIPMQAEAYLDWGLAGMFMVPFFVGILIGGFLLLAPRTVIGETAYVVLLTNQMTNLLDIMIWFLPGLIMLAIGGVALRLYVRTTDPDDVPIRRQSEFPEPASGPTPA